MDSKESQGDPKKVDAAVLEELERMYKLLNDEEPCFHPDAVTEHDGLYTLHCKHCGRYAIADETAARRLGWIE